MNWQLLISFHWPHDRFALGWEILNPVEEAPYTTVQVFLGIFTVTVHLGIED